MKMWLHLVITPQKWVFDQWPTAMSTVVPFVVRQSILGINISRAGAQKVVYAAAEQNYSLDSSRKLRVIQRCEATPTELLN